MAEKFLITGGGTGGHLAVAEALAEQIAADGHAAVYVGSTSGMDAQWFAGDGERAEGGGDGAGERAGSDCDGATGGENSAIYKGNARANNQPKLTIGKNLFSKTYFLPSRGFVGLSKFAKLKALICLLASILRAVFILLREHPRAVISVGGYSALPAALAAAIVRRPLFLHEQNSRMGLANRLCARFCREVFCAYGGTSPAPGEHLKTLRGLGLGELFTPAPQVANCEHFCARYAPYPLRRRVLAARRLRGEIGCVLLLGGSAGASALNAMALEFAPVLRARGVRLIHLCGAKNFAHMKAEYARIFGDVAAATDRAADSAANSDSAAVAADSSFIIANVELIGFCRDMRSLYERADFAISRAGASASAELLAAGVSTLFVPYAHAASNHQFYNALSASSQGFALLCEEANLSAQLIIDIIFSSAPRLIAAELARQNFSSGAGALMQQIYENLKLPPDASQSTDRPEELVAAARAAAVAKSASNIDKSAGVDKSTAAGIAKTAAGQPSPDAPQSTDRPEELVAAARAAAVTVKSADSIDETAAVQSSPDAPQSTDRPEEIATDSADNVDDVDSVVKSADRIDESAKTATGPASPDAPENRSHLEEIIIDSAADVDEVDESGVLPASPDAPENRSHPEEIADVDDAGVDKFDGVDKSAPAAKRAAR